MRSTIQTLIFLLPFTLCEITLAQGNHTNEIKPEIVNVLVKSFEHSTTDVEISVLVYKIPNANNSQSKEQSPVVLFSHGRPGSLAARSAQKNPVNLNIVRYWHSRGYSVVAAVRPGYGDNAAVDPEDSGTKWSGDNCSGKADFQKTANAATHAVKSVHTWLSSQEWVKKDRLLLVGQSVGGLTTVNACGLNWSGVIGCINFAGGSGGNPTASPGKSCKPERVSEVMSNAAKTTQVPSLWLYSANDKYWGEDQPKQWFKAYQETAKAAGQKAGLEFYAAPAVSDNGHSLHVNGMQHWTPVVSKWLDENRF
jgi:dienelactone hydrolase